MKLYLRVAIRKDEYGSGLFNQSQQKYTICFGEINVSLVLLLHVSARLGHYHGEHVEYSH